MSPHAAPSRSYPPLSPIGLRAGRPEPSRYARPHRSLRSLSLTFVPVPPLTMPRAARAPAIPPPPPLPALSLVLTGKVFVVSVKKGRLLSPGPVSVNNIGLFCLRAFNFSTLVNKMGLFCLPSYPQTADLPGFGASMWTVPFQTRGPSTSEAIFPDGHLSNPGTIHIRGRFSGRSMFGVCRGGYFLRPVKWSITV